MHTPGPGWAEAEYEHQLERLEAINADLLAALERLCSVAFSPAFKEVRMLQDEGRAAIAKAKGTDDA